MENQLVAEAGKTKDSDVGIGREAVSELLNELEQLPVNALLAENAGENGRELSLFLNNLSSGVESEKWVTLGEQGSNRSSPPWKQVLLDKVASPNSFQALQGIREEGEIDEDDGIEDELNLKAQDKRYEKGTEGEGKGEGKKAGQSTGQRGKGRGKALIANTRGLVNAVWRFRNSRDSSIEQVLAQVKAKPLVLAPNVDDGVKWKRGDVEYGSEFSDRRHHLTGMRFWLAFSTQHMIGLSLFS
ncbi:hypothetical protein YC2023_051455 [Brassica napus]